MKTINKNSKKNSRNKMISHFQMIGLLVSMTLIIGSCQQDNLNKCDEHVVADCSEDLTKTNIRIKNISNYDFCNVVVNTSSEMVNCGIVKKGEETCYRTFETAYNYAYIQLFIGDKEFILQPIDYVGEQDLGAGKFTYLVNVTDFDARKISIEVQED